MTFKGRNTVSPSYFVTLHRCCAGQNVPVILAKEHNQPSALICVAMGFGLVSSLGAGAPVRVPNARAESLAAGGGTFAGTRRCLIVASGSHPPLPLSIPLPPQALPPSSLFCCPVVTTRFSTKRPEEAPRMLFPHLSRPLEPSPLPSSPHPPPRPHPSQTSSTSTRGVAVPPSCSASTA